MPASSTPHTEGRDTARERGLPGHIGAVTSKDRRSLLLPAGFSACGIPLRASKEPPQGLALSLEHLESSLCCPWDSVPPGWFSTLSGRLCTLPWLLPLSQRECQLGAALTTSGEEGTEALTVPRAVLWSTAGAPEGTGKGRVPRAPTQTWKPCSSTATACPGCHRHGHAPGFLHRHSTASSFSGCPWAPTPDRIFISLSQNSPWPGKLSAPPVHSPTQVQGAMGRTISDPTWCQGPPHSASSHLKVPTPTLSDNPACSLFCACLPCEASSCSIFSQAPCRGASYSWGFPVWDRFPSSLH